MRVSPSVARYLNSALRLVATLLLAGLAVAVLLALWYSTWAERLILLVLSVPLVKDAWEWRA